MKPLDNILQSWRMAKALNKMRYLFTSPIRVLDVGSYDGLFFKKMGVRLKYGIGIEPCVSSKKEYANFILLPGSFPGELPVISEKLDAITMLAVIEHLPENDIRNIDSICSELLRHGGKVIITVPSPFVDNILTVLSFFKLIDGQALHEHHGFDINQIDELFTNNDLFKKQSHEKFQIGLNNLFVFSKN